MNNWVFNESLDFPYCLIHPLALKQIDKMRGHNFPEYIHSVKLHGGALQKWFDNYSDIDLCVLVSEDNEEIKDEAYRYLNALCRNLNLKPDILIEDIETFNIYKDDFDSVEQEIEEVGVFLWQRKS